MTTSSLTIPTVLLIVLLALDFQNIVAYTRQGIKIGTRASEDFTIIVPIFGHPKYLANLGFLQAYKANTLLVINATTPPLRDLATQLERDQWRVLRTQVVKDRPVSWLILHGLQIVTTRYAVRLDGDSRTDGDFKIAAGSIEDAGLDVCSMKVLPSSRDTLAEKMQGVEYDIAMRNRLIRPWLTSGACFMVRTSAFKHILAHHTMESFGEDVELGLLAKHFRMKVGHIEMPIYTDCPKTFWELAKQRRRWWAGSFCLTVLNFDHLLYYPALLAYRLGSLYVLFACHWWALFHYWRIIPLVLIGHLFMTMMINWPVRSRRMLFLPLYEILHSTVFPAMGILWLLNTLRKTPGFPIRKKVRRRRENWIEPAPQSSSFPIPIKQEA